jgi:hypothetical protein
MTGERCDMRAFILELHEEANTIEIRPNARAIVETYFHQMYEDLDDARRVTRLMDLVRHTLADELRSHADAEIADNPSSAVAVVLRRRAAEIEAQEMRS